MFDNKTTTTQRKHRKYRKHFRFPNGKRKYEKGIPKQDGMENGKCCWADYYDCDSVVLSAN